MLQLEVHEENKCYQVSAPMRNLELSVENKCSRAMASLEQAVVHGQVEHHAESETAAAVMDALSKQCEKTEEASQVAAAMKQKRRRMQRARSASV